MWKLLPTIIPLLVACGKPAEEELHLKEFFTWLSAPTISHLEMGITAWLVRAQTESLALVLESVRLPPEKSLCVLQAVGHLLLKTHWPCSRAQPWICIPQVSATSTWMTKSKVKESVKWGALWVTCASFTRKPFQRSHLPRRTNSFFFFFPSFIRLESFLAG